MKPIRRTVLLVLTVGCLASCNGMFFYPEKYRIFNPETVGLDPEDVWFRSQDDTLLNGWFFPAGTDTVKGTILLFHGNAQNMSSHFLSLAWATFKGYNLFIFDYRGYGRSEGEPSMPGLVLDAQAAYEYLSSRPETEKTGIVLYGQSLGGIVLLKALESVAEREAIKCVVIESSFLSYQEIARDKLRGFWLFWPFQLLAYLLISDQYNALEAVGRISPIPLLVIHGRKDEIVPIHFGREVFSLAREPKTFWEIEQGVHINAMSDSNTNYRKKLLDYLNAVPPAF
ncbi:MAG: alpha/beta hydrolase [Deltaproteobacteria bacterium]|nr:alpha/beta hydrolase [Deltaproteobacteria bacterium]